LAALSIVVTPKDTDGALGERRPTHRGPHGRAGFSETAPSLRKNPPVFRFTANFAVLDVRRRVGFAGSLDAHPRLI